MPPKRKLAEAAVEGTTTTTARSTRRSTRNKTVDNQTDDATPTVASGETALVSENPPTKRPRKAPAKTAKATKSSKSKTTTKQPAAGEVSAFIGSGGPTDTVQGHAEPGNITTPK
ncbi:hypothetical protein PHLGIDRAFT_285643 [Phlebiopsis gigantea 11061_1 CR5-6]|uniref:Uncharacterized protein n=1 Tax=Phlebiopsis gigantea (strain 11061_1 CR5-6) TaxID=745531 RepID=A0A0C3NDL1_PHLG1|nr:hypothetical protein PHLGIDRAFT_285643 [Phlebiopsis gigantea 11061_1 CR5-6]